MIYFWVVLCYFYFILEDFFITIFSSVWRILGVCFLASAIFSIIYFSEPERVENVTLLQIPKNSDFTTVSTLLKDSGLISSEILFKQFSIYLGYDKRIRSGEYEIPKGLNDYYLVKELLSIKPEMRKVTIIEGLPYSKIRAELSKSFDLDSVSLANLFSDSTFLSDHEITAQNIEGFIFPQTYYLTLGVSAKDVVGYLISQTKSLLIQHEDAIKEKNLTWLDVLTMASIIQGECIFPDEMATVSSVYWNRIEKGWKLQADPTVQYFLGKPTRLRLRHLRIDHPYNTYKYKGLPPGPINNPGKDAILAAIYPEKTEYMYFVADGTGRHIFGKTLEEHNENRKVLDRLRLKLWREKQAAKKTE